MTVTEDAPTTEAPLPRATVAGLDPNQVTVGTADGPGLWIAPPGTAFPAALAAFSTIPAWKSLGYASDDGVTIGGDTTTEAITPWQSKTPIRTLVTEKTETIQFVLWQLNQDTLSVYFDTTVPAPAAGVINFNVRSDSAPLLWAVAVDVKDGVNQFRVGFPRASLESTGDMTITKSTVVPLDITLSALDDAGVLMTVWSKTAISTYSADEVRANGGIEGTVAQALGETPPAEEAA